MAVLPGMALHRPTGPSLQPAGKTAGGQAVCGVEAEAAPDSTRGAAFELPSGTVHWPQANHLALEAILRSTDLSRAQGPPPSGRRLAVVGRLHHANTRCSSHGILTPYLASG